MADSAEGCAKNIVFPVKACGVLSGSPFSMTLVQHGRARRSSHWQAKIAFCMKGCSLPIHISFASAPFGILGFSVHKASRQSRQQKTGRSTSPMPAQGHARSASASPKRQVVDQLRRRCQAVQHQPGWSPELRYALDECAATILHPSADAVLRSHVAHRVESMAICAHNG